MLVVFKLLINVVWLLINPNNDVLVALVLLIDVFILFIDVFTLFIDVFILFIDVLLLLIDAVWSFIVVDKLFKSVLVA